MYNNKPAVDLVCQDWRPFVNCYSPLWAKVNGASLHEAVSLGHILTAEILIAKGAKINRYVI